MGITYNAGMGEKRRLTGRISSGRKTAIGKAVKQRA
jgi:hypothetical protein